MMLMSSILLNEAFVQNWDQGSGKTAHTRQAHPSSPLGLVVPLALKLLCIKDLPG